MADADSVADPPNQMNELMVGKSIVWLANETLNERVTRRASS